MVPAGYMAKRVVERPDWLRAVGVSAVYSVSGCVSRNFADYIKFWKHNGYWLFDSPKGIVEIALDSGIDLAGTVLFFYEVHELQFGSGEWTRFEPEPSLGTDVRVPEARVFEGYDVVTFLGQSSPECSPLSCNLLASHVETNSRCLLQSFDRARRLLEDGVFNDSEPGPYRIFGVYSVAWPGDHRAAPETSSIVRGVATHLHLRPRLRGPDGAADVIGAQARDVAQLPELVPPVVVEEASDAIG